jgi:hypothetical protein
MAAHSVRCLAQFHRWDVIDSIVANFSSGEAHPYQAPELRFYFLHARLWLLIALARLALDFPERVYKYEDLLKKAALDPKLPHVLMRHFASTALLSCVAASQTTMSGATLNKLKEVNDSPYAMVKAKRRPGGGFYEHRPSSMPEPETEFDLDYEFDKNEVVSVSDVFNKSIWEVRDGITRWVKTQDPVVAGMHETGGREISQRDRFNATTARVQGYGQQLGWQRFTSSPACCWPSTRWCKLNTTLRIHGESG